MQELTSYSEAIARKYPEQVVIAIAKDPQGKQNPITLGWVMPTSHKPPMMAISVGLTRYSLEAIRLSREFVVCFPSSEMAEDALFYGTKSGRDTDKLAVRGTKTAHPSKVEGVLFSDAVANFECTLESELATGDHVIFVGKVVASHRNPDPNVRRLYTLGAHYEMGGVVPG